MPNTTGILLCDNNDHNIHNIVTPLNLWLEEDLQNRRKALMHKNASAELIKVKGWSNSNNHLFDPDATKVIPIFCYSYSYNTDPVNKYIAYNTGLQENLDQLYIFKTSTTPGSTIYIMNAHCNSNNDVLDGDSKGLMRYDTLVMARHLNQCLPRTTKSNPYNIIVLACKCGQVFCHALSFYLWELGTYAKVTGSTQSIECIPKQFEIQEEGNILVTIPKNPLITLHEENCAFASLFNSTEHLTHREFSEKTNFEEPYKITWYKNTKTEHFKKQS